jgi:hypothetical protein
MSGFGVRPGQAGGHADHPDLLCWSSSCGSVSGRSWSDKASEHVADFRPPLAGASVP